jgi:peptidoglycan/LPS O-acetylase OafA/YrhL
MIRNPALVLEEGIVNPQYNNFDFIRLIAALLVILTHCFELFPGKVDPIFECTNHLLGGSFTGLCTFFFLSGILVTQSLRKSISWKNFLWRRFLRIYPAAWLCILSCAFILGPLVTTEKPGNYFFNRDFYKFLANCFLIRIHYSLPGVFEHSTNGPAIIGPFWSICLELKLYIGLFAVWLIGIPRKKALLFLAVLIAILFNLLFFTESKKIVARFFIHPFNPYSYTILTPLFLLGVLCNLYQHKIIVRSSWKWILISLFVISAYFHFFILTVFIILPSFILYLGTQPIGWVKKITPRADFSYGIYVFGQPVIRIVEIYLRPANVWICFSLSVIISVLLAMVSWYLVERKMKQLKWLVK